MTGWRIYWAIWASVAFATFIIPEVIALVTTHGAGTLSVTIWDLEGLVPGQPITKWGIAHLLIGGLLALVLIWLLGHLIFGIWRAWR